MREFTIDRAKWGCGGGRGQGQLLNPDTGKQCCVGIYLSALDVPDDKLVNRGTPVDKDVPPEARWLVNDYGNKTESLYLANDIEHITPFDRESLIRALFYVHDIHVNFKGEYGE